MNYLGNFLVHCHASKLFIVKCCNITRVYNCMRRVYVMLLFKTFAKFIRKNMYYNILVLRPYSVFILDFPDIIIPFSNSYCSLKEFCLFDTQLCPILLRSLCPKTDPIRAYISQVDLESPFPATVKSYSKALSLVLFEHFSILQILEEYYHITQPLKYYPNFKEF